MDPHPLGGCGGHRAHATAPLPPLWGGRWQSLRAIPEALPIRRGGLHEGANDSAGRCCLRPQGVQRANCVGQRQCWSLSLFLLLQLLLLFQLMLLLLLFLLLLLLPLLLLLVLDLLLLLMLLLLLLLLLLMMMMMMMMVIARDPPPQQEIIGRHP